MLTGWSCCWPLTADQQGHCLILNVVPHRYYLNGQDAYRLKLLLPLTPDQKEKRAAQQLTDLSLHGGDCTCHHHGPGAPHEHAEHLPCAPPGFPGESKSLAKGDTVHSFQNAEHPEP